MASGDSSLRSRVPRPDEDDPASTELASDASLLLSDLQKQLDAAVAQKQYHEAARLQDEIDGLRAPVADSGAPPVGESEADPMLLTEEEAEVAARLFSTVQENAVEDATDNAKGCCCMCCGVLGMLWAIIYFDLPV